jgi:DNA-binding MarR family transcriptional regulator
MIIRKAGYLMLGSRLKRLGDRALAEIREVYKASGVDFEISWFPVFYVLHERGTCSIQEISENLEVSHSAISQLMANLERQELIELRTSEEDQRKKEIHLTEKGKRLMTEIAPIWRSFELSLSEHLPKNILIILDQLEEKLDAGTISRTAIELLQESESTRIEDTTYSNEAVAEFIIRNNLGLEEQDRILVVFREDDIIGMMAYHPEGSRTIIRDIFIEPIYRRRGHALALIQDLTDKYPDNPLMFHRVTPALMQVLSLVHHPFIVNTKK